MRCEILNIRSKDILIIAVFIYFSLFFLIMIFNLIRETFLYSISF